MLVISEYGHEIIHFMTSGLFLFPYFGVRSCGRGTGGYSDLVIHPPYDR